METSCLEYFCMGIKRSRNFKRNVKLNCFKFSLNIFILVLARKTWNSICYNISNKLGSSFVSPFVLLHSQIACLTYFYSKSPYKKVSENLNPNSATSKMELFVIIVKGFQPLTIVRNSFILDITAVLDPFLLYLIWIQNFISAWSCNSKWSLHQMELH